MAEMSETSARVRGFLIMVIGLPILGLGLWLGFVTLGRPLPDWVPTALQNAPTLNLPAGSTDAQRMATPPGLGSLFLIGFGTIALAQGLGMLVLGRRSMVLLALMLVFFAMLIGAGLWTSAADLF